MRAIFNLQIYYKSLLNSLNALTGEMLTSLNFKYFTNVIETITSV